ncbi:T9SS type A sorting domain-containing protein [Fluviicola taffensis]|uniref:Blue (Type 1) copper domain protein n=1 Tax=Fluviicola taffensis (strain DSM 16823 / NCIMB 13979 / RW262) TaxID=755732 RepID=F2IH75_FLUTR|nr:T9SS type A sorting domain-containing protein [Fluviicola taffensis]AEA42630.1 blue (type 1) copper domain protein [Fluviicola taffensis DSM 16823]
MRKITQLVFTCLAPIAFGQTDHQVDAQAMAWSPNDLTIDLGDSVTWINNNNGSHNLNGTTATFAANPESFSMLTTGQNWTFGKRFNVPGIYMYRCDVHSAMMTGKVTVVDPNLGLDNKTTSVISFGPNPAVETITIQTTATDFTVVIYDMAGKQVLSENLKNKNQLNISSLKQGTYVIEINAQGKILQEKLVKN